MRGGIVGVMPTQRVLRRLVLLGFVLATAGCATAPPERVEPVEPPAATAPETLRALRYRRLAWTDDMRSRVWLDEIFVPELDVAFNLETETDWSVANLSFIPAVRAFVAHAPVQFSHDLYGRDPQPPETTEIQFPADLARRIRAQADLLDTLNACKRVFGAELDRTEILPAVVGSPRWKPKPVE